VLVIIPVFILIGAAVAVTVLQFVPRGIGFAWLVALVGSLAAWIVFLIAKSSLPFTYSAKLLSDLSINAPVPAFQIDLILWPLVTSILAVLSASILSSSTRLGKDAGCYEWASVLVQGVIGIAICASQNVITALVFLFLFDLIEIFVQVFSGPIERSEYSSHFWRLVSALLFFITFAWNGLDGKNNYEWETLQSIPAQIALIACIVRMGITPIIHLSRISRERNAGLQNTRLLINFILSTAILVQLPVFSGNIVLKNLMFLYLAVSALAAIIYLLKGSTDFSVIGCQIFGGALIVAEYLNGYSASAIIFLSAFLPIIFVFIQYNRKDRFSLITALACIFSFSGLPFTPESTGLAGFGIGASFFGIIFVLLTIPFFFWVIKKAFVNTEEMSPNVERWALAVSPISSLVLVASSWAVFFLWQPNAISFNLSIQALIMTMGGIAIFTADRFHLFDLPTMERVFSSITEIPLNKLRSIPGIPSNMAIAFIEKPFLFVTELFEGEGGILWAVLCLVLIITIISGFGIS
jgi:hypothetical protein